MVVAGDDEDGGAASVTEGAAATAVLGVGEEDGEVRHGVRDPLVGLAGGGVVGDERREAAAFGTPVRTRHVGASSPVVPKGKEKCQTDAHRPGQYFGEEEQGRGGLLAAFYSGKEAPAPARSKAGGRRLRVL